MKKGAGDGLVRSVKYYFYINKYTPEKEEILKVNSLRSFKVNSLRSFKVKIHA